MNDGEIIEILQDGAVGLEKFCAPNYVEHGKTESKETLTIYATG